ncbi:hypothetical protein ANTPLA_LOCUS2965 [Anthophora plagiata]
MITISIKRETTRKARNDLLQEFLLYNYSKILHLPPQSPNLNPIENLWDELDRKIGITPPPPPYIRRKN